MKDESQQLTTALRPADRVGGTEVACRFAACTRRLLLPMLICVYINTPLLAADQDRYIVIKTKKAITISGDDIKRAVIVIKNGKIDAVGSNVKYPADSKVIDASDLVVMPGMINPRSRLGLPDIRRSGNKSHLELADHYYPPEGDAYDRLLEAGYTTVGLYVNGQGLPGQGLVVHTHQPEPRKGIKTEGLIRVTFSSPGRDKKLLGGALKAAKDQIEKDKKASTQPATRPAPTRPSRTQPARRPTTRPTTRSTTRAAGRPTSRPAPKRPTVKPEIKPMMALLKKTEGYMAHVEFSRASDVIHFADAIAKYEFPRAYVFSGSPSDLHHVVDHDLFGKAGALLAFTPTLVNMPLTANPYNRVRRFTEAGCRVALLPPSDSVRGHRQMRPSLVMLVRAGLKREDALKGVTLHAAEMLGLEKQFGSIEKGKNADLIFLDGDPLDPFARVRRVMIDGEIVADYKEAKR